MDFSPVDQIKQKLDIVDVLSDYIKLTKAGRNYKARCPFHNEKTASLMVSPEKQIWHCFGCGAGGDIFSFVMQMEGAEFGDALRLLARRAGVILQKQNPQIQSQKKRLYDACELSAKFFAFQLEKSPMGKKATVYLNGRGLKSETIKEWRIGWAPENWHGLSEFLKSREYKDNEILQAGLVSQGEEGKIYDRFRSRIIFPIFDAQGQVIAFGGRIFQDGKIADEAAKYLNSPQTPLYDKSHILYGLNKSKMEIRQKDLCVLVEGYMDFLMSWQAGIKNAAASSGTALTEEHLKIISRYTKNLAMAFDSDTAGDSATRRSIEMALQQNFRVKVISMQDKDPADVVKKNPADWLSAIDNAQSVMQFYFASTLAKYDIHKLEDKEKIKNDLLPVIKNIASRTEQSEWIRELSLKLHFDEKDLVYDLEKIKEDSHFREKLVDRAFVRRKKSRIEELEDRLLGLCLAFIKLDEKESLVSPNTEVIGDILGISFCDAKSEIIAVALKKILENSHSGNLIEKLKEILDIESQLKIDFLTMETERNPVDSKKALMEIWACQKEIKMFKLKERLKILTFEIKSAQLKGDKIKTDDFLEKFVTLSLELSELKKQNIK